MNYSEIAELLERDQRNIWTIWNNAYKKNKSFEINLEIKSRKYPLKIKKKNNFRESKLFQAIILIKKELETNYSEEKEKISHLLLKELSSNYKVSQKEISKEFYSEEEISIPLSIFSKELGALESTVKYLKENLSMTYKEISEYLGRNERTIWTAYKKASEKHKEGYKLKENDLEISISIFLNKNLTVLESLVLYLKEKGMNYSEIAELLDRDQRNIWTIWNNARIKKF